MRTQSLLVACILACSTYLGCAPPTDSEGDTELSQDALSSAHRAVEGFVEIPDLTEEEKATILAKYASVPHAGVRAELWEKAVLYYDTNYERIPNKRWLSVIDFKKHSGDRRYWRFDMEGGAAINYVVAHGKLSDPNDDGIPTSFSNVEGSNQSSLGYYLTAETYIGANGRSLRLDGLSTTNSNARQRLVVIHGANYVEEGRAKQGRSLGCPAFPHPVVQALIDDIQEGSLIYAWN